MYGEFDWICSWWFYSTPQVSVEDLYTKITREITKRSQVWFSIWPNKGYSNEKRWFLGRSISISVKSMEVDLQKKGLDQVISCDRSLVEEWILDLKFDSSLRPDYLKYFLFGSSTPITTRPFNGWFAPGPRVNKNPESRVDSTSLAPTGFY